jgi:hypothetical protein
VSLSPHFCDPAHARTRTQTRQALSLRPDLAAANEIAFRNNPDQLASLPNHGKATKVLMQHQVCSFGDGCIGIHRDHLAGHNLVCMHYKLP